MKMKHMILMIIAHDALNGVEIYRGHSMKEANKTIDEYCERMGLLYDDGSIRIDDGSIRIEVIYK